MKIYANSAEILAAQVQETGLPQELLPLLDRLDKPRRGWLKRCVHEEGMVEDARQHVAKVVLAAAALDSEKWGISNIRLRTQLLVHELPEVLGIDWTPGEINEQEKHRLERATLEQLLPPDFPSRSKIIQLWLEYEMDKGLPFFLDKMDAVVTAEYYAMVNPDYLPVAEEFYQYGCEKITSPTLKFILRKMHRQTIKDAALPNRNPGGIFPAYFGHLNEL